MHDSRVRHIRANKIRKFHTRVHSCNVITDKDFGRVLVPVNVSSFVLPSRCMNHDKIMHLYRNHCCRCWMSLLIVVIANRVCVQF